MSSLESGFRRLIDAFDKLDIPFLVGGSLASSIHGIHRSTNGIDIVAQITPPPAANLAAELGREFYADTEMMEEALRRGRSFNLVHYASSSKFDIFPLPDDLFDRAEFSRRLMQEFHLGTEELRFTIATPEDNVLAKLRWFRLGGGVSERQWSDIRGVISTKKGVIDVEYMRKWAGHLGVADLLERALGE